MKNEQRYFYRMADGERLSRDSSRVYPPDVFPFGNEEIELFMYQSDGEFHAIEKKTGLMVGIGADMDAAQKDAHRAIDEYGGTEKFVEMIKDTLQRLSGGQEYDYDTRKWDGVLLGSEEDKENLKRVRNIFEPSTEIMAPEPMGAADD